MRRLSGAVEPDRLAPEEAPASTRSAAVPPAFAGSLAKLDPAIRAATVARLQHGHGNGYVQRLARQAALAREPAPAAAPVEEDPRADLDGLRSMSEHWIDESLHDKRDGLLAFEMAVGEQFDYGPLLAGLLGNVIWAAACFTTGPAAFLVSLAGIGVGMAPIYGGKIDLAAFDMKMTEIYRQLNVSMKNQLPRVIKEVHAEGEREGLTGLEVRRRLIRRLLEDDYITEVGDEESGTMPTVDHAAIQQRTTVDLIADANRYTASLWHPTGGGRFIYRYDIRGWRRLREEPLMGHVYDVNPFDTWQVVPKATRVYIPQGGANAFAHLKKEPLVKPAEIGWATTIELYDPEEFNSGILWIDLLPGGAFGRAQRMGVFWDVQLDELEPEGLAAKLWTGSGAKPPDVPGAQLELDPALPRLQTHEIDW